MSLDLSLSVLAGVGALALAIGVLSLDRRRPRNLHFAALATALAIWNLGIAARHLVPAGWRSVALGAELAGGCASAPLALQFALGLAGAPRARRRVALLVATAVAVVAWALLAALKPASEPSRGLAAIVLLGPILLSAAAVIGLRGLRLPPGPQRRAHGLVFAGGIVAVLGGLSDFLPPDWSGGVHVGSPSVLVFLLIVCSVVVRERFLDVAAFWAYAVAALAAAATIALVYRGVLEWIDPAGRFVTLFVVSLALVVAGARVGRRFTRGARSLLGLDDRVAAVLQKVSERLAEATSTRAIVEVIHDGRQALPGNAAVELWVRAPGEHRFRRVFASGRERAHAEAADAADPLPAWLARHPQPVTRSFLEVESADSPEHAAALAALTAAGQTMVVPIVADGFLRGWLSVDLDERYVTAEAAAGFLALANQAIASRERLEAVERARQRESLAAVGEMAAGLAHEIRNPVAAIRGAAQALGPEATPAQRRDMLDVIEQESERLGRFAGEFLDYARPRPPRLDAVDVRGVIERSARALRASGKGIHLDVCSPGPCPPVRADAELLGRAIDNLLRNAWEATGDGVAVRVEIRPRDAGHVAVRIEDNGPGIPAERVEEVFRPFHSGRAGGTGLGLSLVHRIVESHGGTIRVAGGVGGGAAFELVLPAGEGDRDA